MSEEVLEFISKPNPKGIIEKFVKVQCPNCKKERLKRFDKYKNCKSLLCLRCNGLNNLKPNETTHGLSDTRIYRKYHNMIHRCYNENNKAFKWYGGRGISICDEWLDPKNGLQNFTKYAYENGFNEMSKLQIDRIDNDGDYCPENCQFITQKENLAKMRKHLPKNNKKKSKMYEYKDLVNSLCLEEVNEKEQIKEEKKLVPLWDFLENLGKSK